MLYHPLNVKNVIKKYHHCAIRTTKVANKEHQMGNRQTLLDLFLTFMKIGFFTFGGGYAMLALMDNECVEKKQWITHDEFMDITIIAESTPGPIAINGATYIGYHQAGYIGAIFATVGIIVPSFVVLYLISLFFDNLLEISIIANAFKGIKVAVGMLILNAAFKMVKKMHKQVMPVLVMTGSLMASLVINIFQLNFSTIYLILIAALVNVSIFLIRKYQYTGKEDDK